MNDSATGDPQQMNRRQLLRHTAWFGAAVGLSVVGGEVLSHVAGNSSGPAQQPTLRFAQVSDSHIGFTGAANADVGGSFTHAIDTINNLGYTPDFVIHTGDLTHLATAEQFDQVRQMMTGLRTPHVWFSPFRGNMIRPTMPVPSTGRPLGRALAVTVGTASISPGCMSSHW